MVRLFCPTLMTFSCVVPSVGEDHVRCNGGLGGARFQPALPVSIVVPDVPVVSKEIWKENAETLADSRFGFGDVTPSDFAVLDHRRENLAASQEGVDAKPILGREL
jgi:hypothetical protein